MTRQTPSFRIGHGFDVHGFKQGDLTGIGSQGVVSEILSGKRKLNIRQIKLLSQQFNVSPAVFI